MGPAFGAANCVCVQTQCAGNPPDPHQLLQVRTSMNLGTHTGSRVTSPGSISPASSRTHLKGGWGWPRALGRAGEGGKRGFSSKGPALPSALSRPFLGGVTPKVIRPLHRGAGPQLQSGFEVGPPVLGGLCRMLQPLGGEAFEVSGETGREGRGGGD